MEFTEEEKRKIYQGTGLIFIKINDKEYFIKEY